MNAPRREALPGILTLNYDSLTDVLACSFEWAKIDGRDEPVSITIRRIDGGPLRATDLRLPFRELADADLAERVRSSDVATSTVAPNNMVALTREENAAIRAESYQSSVSELIADAAEDRVAVAAQLYQLAAEHGLPPTREVAINLGITYGAAAYAVTRGRTRGLLPPTTPGRARANTPSLAAR